MPALPATQMTVPSTDYCISDYKQHATRNGVAYTAALRRHGDDVAHVENNGNGGRTLITFTGPNRVREERRFTDWANRWHGTWGDGFPYDPEAVVEELITEHEVRALLDRNTPHRTPVRPSQTPVVDEDGNLRCSLVPLDPQHHKFKQVVRAAVGLPAERWTGNQWVRV